MSECPKCGSRNILADRSCKPCGLRPLGPVPGSALRGCDTLMESAVRLMVATLARGGCTHDMPAIAQKIGLSEVHIARMASLLTECADSLRHAQNESSSGTGGVAQRPAEAREQPNQDHT